MTPAHITANPGAYYAVNYDVQWTYPKCDRSTIRMLLSNQSDPSIGNPISWFTVDESATGKQEYNATLGGSRAANGSLFGEDRLNGTRTYTSVSLAGIDLKSQVYLIVYATLTGALVHGAPATLRASQAIPITVDPMP